VRFFSDFALVEGRLHGKNSITLAGFSVITVVAASLFHGFMGARRLFFFFFRGGPRSTLVYGSLQVTPASTVLTIARPFFPSFRVWLVLGNCNVLPSISLNPPFWNV